jgi:serpin B
MQTRSLLFLAVLASCKTTPGPTDSMPLTQTTASDAASTSASAPAPTSPPDPGSSAAFVPTSDTRAAESAFAARLYGEARKSTDGSLAMSPLSARVALVMAWAGAHGQTADEMAKVLSLSGPPADVHTGFAAMLRDLTAAPPAPQHDWQAPAPILKVADRLWGQAGRPFVPAFLDLLSSRYGAPLATLDFAHAPDDARGEINRWVSDATEHKVTELLGPGTVQASTALVLTNAVYMKATWDQRFMKSMTAKGPFHAASGKTVQADLMEQTEEASYVEMDGAQIFSLPYAESSLAMTIVLPKDRNGLPALESAMGPDSIARWTAARGRQRVHVVMPRFRVTSSLSLGDALAHLGMPTAFDSRAADFSGMDGTRQLYISVVVHKAYVAVDEDGTEAAAATAVAMKAGAAAPTEQPVEVRVDHPFFFCVRDGRTGAVLFTGRVTDPT